VQSAAFDLEEIPNGHGLAASCDWASVTPQSAEETHMSVKILNVAIISGLLLATAAPAFAADPAAPTTKADCEKAKDMRWDATAKACVKK
jgi:hypothetical protein